MAKNGEEMSDSEILQLLADYHVDVKDMSSILKQIKKRDFESVLQFIDEYVNTNGVDEERERFIKEAKERNHMQRQEAEFNRRYKKQLIEKISANRLEQKQRESAEIKEISGGVEKTVEISSFIKVKLIANSTDIFLFGLDEAATVEDLFEKAKAEMKASNFVLRRHGHMDEISISKSKVYELYKARSMLLEAEFK